MGSAFRRLHARLSPAGRPLVSGRMTSRDMVSPEMVRFAPDHVELADGRVACTVTVRAYPRRVDFGWLDSVYALDGEYRCSQYIEPIDSAAALAELARDMRSSDASLLLAEARGAPHDAVDRTAAEDAGELRQALARGELRLFRHHLLITVFADGTDELRRRCALLLALLAGQMVYGQRCLLQQQAAFVATMPTGRGDALCAPRNFDSNALASTFPFTCGDLSATAGELWGLDLQLRTPVTVDRLALSNPHTLCLAGSGAGKSFWCKHLLAQNVLAGRRAVVLDPQGEYERWCRAVGGTHFSLGRTTGLNPLAPPNGRAGDEWRSTCAERLISLLDLLGEPVTNTGSAAVWAALDAAEAGSAEPPTLEGVAVALSEGDPAAQRMGLCLRGALLGGLRPFAAGGDLAPGTGSVVFDLRTMVSRPGPVVAAALFLLTQWILDHLVRPDLPPLILAVDEAHHLLVQPVAARFLEVLFRSGRKRGVAMCLATQSVGDLLGTQAHPDAVRAARAALANAATVFLMRQQNGQEVAWLRDLYHLDPAEADWLLTCGAGEGLLLAGPRRARIRVEAPQALRDTFSTDPSVHQPP